MMSPPDRSEPVLDTHGRPIALLTEGSPSWMEECFADPPREKFVLSDGLLLEVQEWGRESGPGALLVHGQGANADWWRFIAPQLVAATGRVIAFSLSGMGVSDRRANYQVSDFAVDIAGIAAAKGLLEQPGRSVFIGHSFGCLPLLSFAAAKGKLPGALYLIDFYVPPPGRPQRPPPIRKPRLYASFEEAMGRFRLSPEQGHVNAALVDYVARRGVRRTTGPEGDRWTWCGDPGTIQPVDHARTRQDLSDIACPVAILRGGRSRLVDDAVIAHIRELAPAKARFVEIPDADHHVLLDQPLALVAALRALLAADGLSA